MYFKYLVLALLGFSISLTGRASPTTETDFFDLSIEELLNVTVSGVTLTDESLTTVPSAVSVYTRHDFNRMGVDTVEELMNFVPGFQSYRNGESSSLTYSSRGHKAGTTSIEVLMLIDGNRIETNVAGGADSIYAQTLLDRIAKIEFIRGPGSVIYGSNAYMGVINITTVSNMNAVNVKVGSHQHINSSIVTSTDFDDQQGSADVFLQYAQDQGDLYTVPSSFQTGDEHTRDPIQIGVMQAKVNWKNAHFLVSYNAAQADEFYLLGNVSEPYNTRKLEELTASFQQDFSFTDTYTSHLKFTYNKRDVATQLQISANGAFDGISQPNSTDPLITSIIFDLYDTDLSWFNDVRLSTTQSVQFGLEHRYSHVDEVQLKNNYNVNDITAGTLPITHYDTLTPTRMLLPTSTQNIYSGFAQYQFHAWSWLDINLGARYDNYEIVGHNLSPRVALMLHPSPQDTFKILYSSAFNAPAFFELKASNNNTLVGNTHLKPETVDTLEVVWLSQLHDINLSLNYFHNTFEDSISQGSVNGVRTYVNHPDTQTNQGVEIEIQSYITEHWYMRVGATSIFNNNDTSYREADKLFSAIMNYQHNKWNVNLSGYYHSARSYPITDDTNLGTLEGYWLAHAKVIYKFWPKWETYVQVKNLFDEPYATPPQSAGVEEGIPNRGREFRIGLTWQFN